MSRTVMVAVLAGACASPVHAPAPVVAQPTPPRGGGQPGPARGVFPENAARVTAKVLAQKTYRSDSLPAYPYVGELPATLDALTLEIQDARPARAGVEMGPAIGTLEAFSRTPLPPGLTGQRIEATLTLVGDTLASRWFISDVRTLP